MAKSVKGVLQVLSKYIKQYDSKNYIPVDVDLSDETWNTLASHEILTVTGLVKLLIIPEVTVAGTVTTADLPTICLGHEGDTDLFIGDTEVDDLAVGEIWFDTSPTEKTVDVGSVVNKYVNGVDIGIEVKGEIPLTGTIIFHCWWEQINSTGNVVEGEGGSLT